MILHDGDATVHTPATAFFERHSELGAVFMRGFIAFVLIYGTQDNILSWAQMIEFRDFLERNGFPWPLLSAHVSVYTQFLCGCLILIGYRTRLAASLMIVNFLVALGMVHIGLPFSANIAPLAMLFGSVFLLFHGPGPYALDTRRSPTAAAVTTRRAQTFTG
jgi:putative oxidoreductase